MKRILVVWFDNGNCEQVEAPSHISVVEYARRLAQLNCVGFITFGRASIVTRYPVPDNKTFLITDGQRHELTPPHDKPSFEDRWNWAAALALEAISPSILEEQAL